MSRLHSSTFKGARLREGREARGFLSINLAERLGVTRQALSQYESGAIVPNPTVFAMIVRVLDLPASFFLREQPIGESLQTTSQVFFRSMAPAVRVERAKAKRRTDWGAGFVEFILQYVDLPAVRIGSFRPSSDFRDTSFDQIERTTLEIRESWGVDMSPLGNAVWLLENNGIVILRDELGARELDAFSSWRGQIPFITLGTDKGSTSRSRFDIFHELAHLVLHKNVTEDQIKDRSDHKLIEKQANWFAAAMLLPREQFSRELLTGSLDEFVNLKARWGASIALQMHRAHDIGLIDNQTWTRLRRSRDRRGWKTEEPLEHLISQELPLLLVKSFELIRQHDQSAVARISEFLPVPSADIERITGLPSGSLLGDEPSPLPLRPKLVQEMASMDLPAKNGRILPFRGMEQN